MIEDLKDVEVLVVVDMSEQSPVFNLVADMVVLALGNLENINKLIRTACRLKKRLFKLPATRQ